MLSKESNVNYEIMKAATVAAVVGRVGVQRACELARENFRSLSFATLTPEDLCTSLGKETTLFQRTRSAHLGQVDIFFSHSWSDSPSHKWAALQEWCAPSAHSIVHSLHSALHLDQGRVPIVCATGARASRLRCCTDGPSSCGWIKLA